MVGSGQFSATEEAMWMDRAREFLVSAVVVSGFALVHFGMEKLHFVPELPLNAAIAIILAFAVGRASMVR